MSRNSTPIKRPVKRKPPAEDKPAPKPFLDGIKSHTRRMERKTGDKR